MKLLKMKKNKIDKEKPTFVVELTEDEYVQTKNFLENNKNGLVYIGDGIWKSPDSVFKQVKDTVRDSRIMRGPDMLFSDASEEFNDESDDDSNDEIILNEDNTIDEVQ